MLPRFVHLKVHSDFSMINGLAKVKPLVKTAVADNMVAMALTDFTNFCGLVKFYGEALSSGLKPIIGADILVRAAPECEELDELTLLAKKQHRLSQHHDAPFQSLSARLYRPASGGKRMAD